MKTLAPACLLLFLAGCSPQRPDTTAKETNTVGSIVRLDPALDALIPPAAKIEKIATASSRLNTIAGAFCCGSRKPSM